ncbi:tyrosine-type recombinase/integrase [Novosphingobium capsulatum]|uniref:tyrosine-type recombinase/integrase n=1 Tax=Novosphingobium capsulatum TaxID=13688 RepID=UPI001FE177CA|nr:integrase arm-type DNA-binding domain-containing protein [Novosphingobium capsulatum]WQD92734.1 integrase arm-type DNA-binding domain-containing protein [Novosphingobium capsulatum]
MVSGMVSGLPIYGIEAMLNDAKVKAAKPRDKSYRLTDSGQLYLQVQPTGSRLWRMNYSYRSAATGALQQKTLALGAYPAVTLLEARKQRDAAKELLRQGIDPGVQRKLAVETNTTDTSSTFEVVARRWWEKQCKRWSKVHAADVLASLEANVFPAIGSLPITSIRTPTVLAALEKVERRGAVETAHRLRSRISSVFVYAIGAGLAESDPAAGMGKALQPKPKAKKQPAVTTLPQLRQMLIDCEAERCRAGTKLALRFLALTAVRPGELRQARWDQFEGLDGEAPLWRIPASAMKGDESRKAEAEGDHLVPLAPEAVAVLRVMHGISGDLDLVFPGERHPHRPISENTLRALLIRAGYYQRHVPHGFRAGFSTLMNERAERKWREAGGLGASPDRAIIDLMLAHVPDGVSGSERAYNRAAYMPRRRELACEWAGLLLADFWPPEIHLGQPIRYAATGPGR